jgi:hypothetical protein
MTTGLWPETREGVERGAGGFSDFSKKLLHHFQEHITREFPSTLTSQIKIYIVEYYIP